MLTIVPIKSECRLIKTRILNGLCRWRILAAGADLYCSVHDWPTVTLIFYSQLVFAFNCWPPSVDCSGLSASETVVVGFEKSPVYRRISSRTRREDYDY